MKKIYGLLCGLMSAFALSQVGINTNNPHSSSILEVYAANKGVTLPKVNLKSLTDIVTIPSPRESLLVFNTNTALPGGTGYYYWDGSKWAQMFSENNKAYFSSLVQYYTAHQPALGDYTTGAYYFSQPAFVRRGTYSIGDDISSAGWYVFSELSKTLKVDRTPNQAVVTVSGIAQVNNTNTGGSMELVMGLFVNDKLADVRPLYFPFSSKCAFREFNVLLLANNITPNENNSVKIAVIHRSLNASTGDTASEMKIYYGAQNTEAPCNDGSNRLSRDEMRLNSSIFLTQPY